MLSQFFLGLLHGGFQRSLLFFYRLIEQVSTSGKRGYQFAIGENNCCAAFLYDDAFQLLNLLKFTLLDLAGYLSWLNVPDGTSPDYIDTVDQFHGTAVGGTFGILFSTHLSLLGILLCLSRIVDFTLSGTLLLVENGLLLTGNVAIQGTASYGISHSADSIGQETFPLGLL